MSKRRMHCGLDQSPGAYAHAGQDCPPDLDPTAENLGRHPAHAGGANPESPADAATSRRARAGRARARSPAGDRLLAAKGDPAGIGDPAVELDYWRGVFRARPYVRGDLPFEVYEPAYRLGWEAWWVHRSDSRDFFDAEPALAYSWGRRRGGSILTWVEARQAVQDAWSRLESALGRRRTAPQDVEPTIVVLKELLGICMDGAIGFRLASEHVHGGHAALLRRFASEREGFATQLMAEVRSLGGTAESEAGAWRSPHHGGSGAGMALPGGSRAFVAACAREGGAAVEAYRTALESLDMTPGARALIRAQYHEVLGAHGRVTELHRAYG